GGLGGRLRIVAAALKGSRSRQRYPLRNTPLCPAGHLPHKGPVAKLAGCDSLFLEGDFTMTTRSNGQFSFVEALMPTSPARAGRLDRLSGLVKWYRFEKRLARLRPPHGPGRPAYAPLLMFKALLL